MVFDCSEDKKVVPPELISMLSENIGQLQLILTFVHHRPPFPSQGNQEDFLIQHIGPERCAGKS